MIGILTKMLRQTCVYWAPATSGRFDNFGRPESADPVELACRWEDTAEEFIDAQGTRLISKAKVFVSQDLEVGGQLMLGELDDLDSDQAPPSTGATEIKSVMKTPDFRGKQYLRTVML